MRASMPSSNGPAVSRATPMALLVSSTAPMAAKRRSALERREPSLRPLCPPSPPRV
jgi:hypothetical protein